MTRCLCAWALTVACAHIAGAWSNDELFSRSTLNCTVRVGCTSPAATQPAEFACVAAEFSASASLTASQDSTLVVARPATCCTDGCAVSRGAVALLDRGGCSFHRKAWLAARAGAIAVVVRNLHDGPAVPMATDPGITATVLDIPVVMLNREDGAELRTWAPGSKACGATRASVQLRSATRDVAGGDGARSSGALPSFVQVGVATAVGGWGNDARSASAAVSFMHNPSILVHAQLQHLREATPHPPLPGFALFVHAPASCRFISKSLIETGVWEPAISQRILGRLALGLAQESSGTGQVMGGMQSFAGVQQHDAQRQPQRQLFIDVGANVGWFSLLAAARGFDVLSIEPMEFNMELLRASAARLIAQDSSSGDSVGAQGGDRDVSRMEMDANAMLGARAIEHATVHRGPQASMGNLELVKTALSDTPAAKQRPMCVLPAFAGDPLANAGNGQLHELSPSNAANCTDVVHTTTLDELLLERLQSAAGGRRAHPNEGSDALNDDRGSSARAGWAVFAMKLDIEGYETRALRGAHGLLSGSAALGGAEARPCFVFAEHWAKYARWSGVGELEIFKIMFGHGYDAYSIDGWARVHPADLVAGSVRDGDYEFRLRAPHCPEVPPNATTPV